MNRKYILPMVVLGIIIALSIGSFFVDLSYIQENIKNAGPLAPILYILIKSSTVIFAPLSGTALYILSVPLFGFWLGIFYSFLGDLLGAVVTFYISRLFGRPVVVYFAGKKNMIYIEQSLELMSTIKGFFILRLGTLTMPEVASYAAGLSKIKFLPFILIHMAVDLIPIVIITLPGLLIGEKLPLWLVITVIFLGILITVINLIIFAFMIRKKVILKQNKIIT
jgi:uncharacterized membrane protein YdjX (TVP38/TMEM64 family)